MIWAAALISLAVSFPAWGDDEERALEAGEVMQEGCLNGTCYKLVNTKRLTNNAEVERELVRRLMETDLAPPAISNTDGAAVREK